MNTEAMIEIMQDYVDGNAIEVRVKNNDASGEWCETSLPYWDWHCCTYRVKRDMSHCEVDNAVQK